MESPVTLLPQPDSPDQRGELASFGFYIHAVNRFYDAPSGEKVCPEISDLQKVVLHLANSIHSTFKVGIYGIAQTIPDKVES